MNLRLICDYCREPIKCKFLACVETREGVRLIYHPSCSTNGLCRETRRTDVRYAEIERIDKKSALALLLNRELMQSKESWQRIRKL